MIEILKNIQHNYSLAIKQMVLICCAILIPTIGAYSQKATVQATIEPAEIMIGEQALLDLKVIAPKDMQISFPVYDKEIMPGLEVLTMLKPDTLIENNVMTLHFKYVVTSFDSTLYYVPSIPISNGLDTIYSNAFGLKVTSPELSDSTKAYLEKLKNKETDSIDFNQLQLADIKPIQKPPFVWTDYLWILWIFAGAILIILLVIGITMLIVNKKRKGYFFKPPEVLPAHVRAIKALDKLKDEKIWQKGHEKEFYTKITDILRQYMTERFGVNAMEMTSGEILQQMQTRTDKDSVMENLKQILSTADLVKFAKYKPYTDENDLAMMNSYFFVNQTREPDPVPDPKDKPKEQATGKEGNNE
ncbi:MAG: hypothetical protein VB024_04835 [Dysgonamonadaceae bacterium]|jgi:hypothetical protein|nr:hypothetical protein [Dysgonamonadaceae bacterium]MDD3309956.1 hypothetical protein [Dysgonamonadaceae bacterium]MDD3899889.1 hypothetical protein [Dysgonamonadaceae bacterium]MDD4398587.1 hypothetical protein [Dysgonamonadaceae bacterium]MEA5080936.1 hypothetical protein [Dysgonamonadaceae bacterium]